MKKKTYMINGHPAAIVTESNNKFTCELLGFFQIALIGMSNNTPIEASCGSVTPFSTVSDLKKLVYGKDTFIVK